MSRLRAACKSTGSRHGWLRAPELAEIATRARACGGRLLRHTQTKEALRRIGGQSAIRELILLYSESKHSEQYDIIDALGDIDEGWRDSEGARDAVTAMLGGGDASSHIEILTKIGARDAIGPLIDVLVTTHKFEIVSGQGGGGMQAINGPGGAGLNMGQSKKIVTEVMQNQQVLNTLITLIGGEVVYTKP